jgi:hypothetical protein
MPRPARLYLAPDGSPLRVVPSPDAPSSPYAAQPGPAAPRMAPAPTAPPLARPGPVLGYYRAGRFTPAAVAPECQYPGWAAGGAAVCPGCAECDADA